MPTYTFFNEQAGVEYDEVMTIAEMEKFVKDNPHIKRVWHGKAPAMVGDHMMGVGPKTDSGFNDVLGNIADNNPLSPMASKYGTSKTASQRRAKDTFTKVTKKYKNKLNNLNK